MTVNIDCFGETHVGCHRPSNEDQYLIADLNKSMRVHQTSLGLNHQTRLFGGSQGKLFLVADGLGGHESGERASTLAVDGVANYVLNAMNWFFKVDDGNQDQFERELKTSFRHSQAMVEAEADAIPQRRGMATTLTMAYVDWPQLYVVHVGDTRCYHMRGGDISCLTTDHTMGELVAQAERDRAAGFGSEHETARHHPMKNALWNVIGGHDRAVDPQISRLTLAKGDCLLLCSDGLTRHLENHEIQKLISSKQTSRECCQQLVAMANERGGKDNVTVVVAKFVENEKELEDCETQQAQTDNKFANASKPQILASQNP